MMDAGTQRLVAELIRQEGRSMIQYVNESFPWTTPANASILAELRTMGEEEQQGAQNLAKLLLRNHGRPPFLGAYPTSFTNINFVSLDHLLPLLARFGKDRIVHLESLLSRILHEETRGLVRELTQVKRRHVARLEELAAVKAGGIAAPSA